MQGLVLRRSVPAVTIQAGLKVLSHPRPKGSHDGKGRAGDSNQETSKSNNLPDHLSGETGAQAVMGETRAAVQSSCPLFEPESHVRT